MQNNPTWLHPAPLLKQGVIVGCDERQEWILPWWWKHYSAHNTLPVLFVDFGLSAEAAQWCDARGKVVSLPSQLPSVKPKNEIDPLLVDQWECAYGKEFWKGRPSWFKKPFALLQTPFEKSLWLDIDCEVKADLNPLLDSFTSEFALAPEPEYAQEHMHAFHIRQSKEKIYNSGVILYRHLAPFIPFWADACHARNGAFWSDQHLLSRLLYETEAQIPELPQVYNWHMALGKNEQAQIVHWLGDPGKEYICLSLHGFL